MPYWRTYYHLVWTTKNREPLITPEVEKRLYPYLLGKARDICVRVYAINGWSDHVHLVVSIPPTLSVADVVKRLKGASSHDLGSLGVVFEWQRGYGVLTMGEKQRPFAEQYVREQKTHHAEGAVIRALEHCAELDEGPAKTDTPVKIDSLAVREEEPPAYDVTDAGPF
jgi:putative transposase